MDNEKARKLLEQIFNLWTGRFEDENGNELRLPASQKETDMSRQILIEISVLDFDEQELKQRYEQLDGIVAEYEEKYALQKTPDGQADKLLDAVFDIWSDKWEEDGAPYGKPANEDEVNKSWEIIRQIEKIEITDEAVANRLESYISVLKAFKDTPEEQMDGEQPDADESPEDKNNRLAYKKLDEVYNSWTSVSYAGDEEYRSPKNKKQVRKSRSLLKKIKSMKATDPGVQYRIDELKEVLKSYEEAIPGYWLRILFSIALSAGILAGSYYLYNNYRVHPDFTYDAKKFVVDRKGGDLSFLGFTNPGKGKKTNKKIHLNPGTKVKPIARYGKFFFQVETPDGQRGLIRITELKMSRYVVSVKNCKVFSKVGAKDKEIIPAGIKATIIDRYEKKVDWMTDRYIKVRLEDGRVKWASNFSFAVIGLNDIPKINKNYKYSTTREMAEKYILVKPLPEIENHYGLAFSVAKSGGRYRAFFKHLEVVDKDKHYVGIIVKFNRKGLAQEIVYTDEGETRWLDAFPFVEKMRAFEPGRMQNYLQYDQFRFQPQWWNNFRKYNIFTGILVFALDVLIWILLVAFVIVLSRVLINPILQLFTFPRILNNVIVILLNSIVILVAAYLAFVLLVFLEDGFFFVGIISLLTTVGLLLRNKSNILYNRCPSCHTMYSALGEGSTYTGRTTSVSWGTYDKYKGTTETDTTITKHYERRRTETTEDVDHYLDHRMCARCGYAWDVDREESEEHIVHL